MMDNNGNVTSHIPCPDCGSSDGMTDYGDHTYCFVCHRRRGNTEGNGRQKMTVSNNNNNTQYVAQLIPQSQMQYKDLKKRGIKEGTCRKYRYMVTTENGNVLHVANYCNDKGEILWQKTRDGQKNFRVRGKKENRFFGQQLFQGGKKLVVTEGEIDCLTVSQINDNKYPVVSIPYGAQSLRKTLTENIEWLLKFEEIILLMDADQVGENATKNLTGILPPHRLKIARIIGYKDPNAALMDGHPEVIIHAIYGAQEYRPDGIRNAADMKDYLLEKVAAESYPYPWGKELNDMTCGIRKGEMTLITAGSGIGKSTVAREIAYYLHERNGQKMGLLMLEESPRKTLRDILSVHLERPLHLLPDDEQREIITNNYDDLYGSGGYVLYDHFGAIESDNLLDKIRYMIVCDGCDYVILDHITIATTAMSGNLRGSDERQVIDQLMVALRSLVEETGAGLIVLSHLRKTTPNGRSYECGGTISLDDLRGSGSLKQIPDTVIGIERNQQADTLEERNQLKLRLLKCRYTGMTGMTDTLQYNRQRARLENTMSKEEEEIVNGFLSGGGKK